MVGRGGEEKERRKPSWGRKEEEEEEEEHHLISLALRELGCVGGREEETFCPPPHD